MIEQNTKIEPCKCGAECEVWFCYSTGSGLGHGRKVRCKNNHFGPWAKTEIGAIRTWNQLQRSDLTHDEVLTAMSIGFSAKHAIKHFSKPPSVLSVLI